MNYRIVSDCAGRIRLRTGAYHFTFDEARNMEAHLASLAYVEQVRVSHSSGSLLIYYTDGFRGSVLESVSGLTSASLPPATDTALVQMSEVEQDFKKNVFRLVRNHLLAQILLPTPLQTIRTIYRSLRFFKRGLDALGKGKLSVDVLDAAAIGGSFLQGDFTTASSVMLLLNITDLLEAYTRKKTRLALTESLAINVDSVWLVEDGQERNIPISQLRVGDQISVRAGSIIPVDGSVVSGEAMVNQSSMTGEPLAVFKKQGDSVFDGTVLEDGAIHIEVRALSGESRISQIVNLIDQSERLKANIHSQAEKLADQIVPASFLLAAAVMIFTRDWRKAVSVFMVDYSCAIKLTTPISVISAMREASNNKIMVKGGRYLEAMAQADTIVFDKTGTLTEATPTVSKVVPCKGYSRAEILRTSACLEEHFPHSVARAVVQKALDENLRHDETHAEVEYIVAHGIATTIEGRRAVIGSHHFVFEDENIPYTDDLDALVKAEVGGDSVIFLAIGGQAAGFICINDPPRDGTADVIRGLKNLGISRIIMLTGDSEATARVVAHQLGIDEYRSQVLPEDKSNIVKTLKTGGHKVIMVGDGVNDSPALAAADVSVSMKDASDIAKEVSDITLLRSNLSSLLTIRILSQRLLTRIHRNYRFILLFNSGLLALGLFGTITAGTSALLHNSSTILLSAGSMRPLLKEKDEQKK